MPIITPNFIKQKSQVSAITWLANNDFKQVEPQCLRLYHGI